MQNSLFSAVYLPTWAKRFLRLSCVIAGLLPAISPSAAQADESLPVIKRSAADGSAGLGFVVRLESSPYRGATTQYDLSPIYSYEGERLFLRTNRAGIKLLDMPVQQALVFVERRIEAYPKDMPESLKDMTRREVAADLGLSYRLEQSWGALQAEWVHDIGNTYQGHELRLGYSYDWQSGRLKLRPSVSVALRDTRLNNYYYGVLPSEATASRPAYAPGAGLNTNVGLYGSYELTPRWRLLGGVSATVLPRKVSDSPIVQKRVLPAVYLGASYDFGAPESRTAGAESHTPTYFKLLYGKSTEDGCHLVKILSARCLSTAKTNSTSIVGVHVGKPFAQNFNGWPVDLVGYVGLSQHNEHGLQPNGAQIDLFMKAFYTGFPWSTRVKTRLGLGAGVSLAQRVPYIEASSLAVKGKTGSRLLNYLDPSIDVSLGDLINYRPLKDTYLGFGVSHRSGIFGSSRLLGGVSGGSNYIYGYVETAL